MPRQTYVAEIDGESIMAFPARDEIDANNQINGLYGHAYHFLGIERPDGKPLWNGESPVMPRLATEAEIDEVKESFHACGFRYSTEGAWGVYLVPIVPAPDYDVDDDDEDPLRFLT